MLTLSVCSTAAIAQTSPATAQLKIGGAVSKPLTLTVADLKTMPRTTLHVTNSHEKKTDTYEGVLLEELLGKAGMAARTTLQKYVEDIDRRIELRLPHTQISPISANKTALRPEAAVGHAAGSCPRLDFET